MPKKPLVTSLIRVFQTVIRGGRKPPTHPSGGEMGNSTRGELFYQVVGI